MRLNTMYGAIVGLRSSKYGNGTPAVIALMEFAPEEEGMAPEVERVTVSVNLDHGQAFTSRDLPPEEFFVKNYSEGGPIFDALLKGGYIETTGINASSGHVNVPACRLTDKAKAVIEPITV